MLLLLLLLLVLLRGGGSAEWGLVFLLLLLLLGEERTMGRGEEEGVEGIKKNEAALSQIKFEKKAACP